MDIQEYKQNIKTLVDNINNEQILMQLKNQLEWDMAHGSEITFSEDECQEVQEGLGDYEAGNVISMQQFLDKRK